MTLHQPILVKEVLNFFYDPSLGHLIDGTLGGGGHTKLFLKTGRSVTGLDRNVESILSCQEMLSNYPNLDIQKDNFTNFKKYLKPSTNAIFLDLGLSMSQIKDYNLGLSFTDTNLDMRLDQSDTLTAKDIVNKYSEADLNYIFSKYSQETNTKKITRAIINSRPINTAIQLATIINQAIPQRSKINPATKVFMTLRILVNKEYQALEDFLNHTLDLKTGTKVGIITFHSGEDRIVKTFLNQNKSLFAISKPILTSPEEQKLNPASRSAIFRAYQKL